MPGSWRVDGNTGVRKLLPGFREMAYSPQLMGRSPRFASTWIFLVAIAFGGMACGRSDLFSQRGSNGRGGTGSGGYGGNIAGSGGNGGVGFGGNGAGGFGGEGAG